jgi:hypothetical protein
MSDQEIISGLAFVGAMTVGVGSLFALVGIFTWIREQWGLHVSKSLAVERLSKQVNDLGLENIRLKYELAEHKRLFGVSSAVKDKTDE